MMVGSKNDSLCTTTTSGRSATAGVAACMDCSIAGADWLIRRVAVTGSGLCAPLPYCRWNSISELIRPEWVVVEMADHGSSHKVFAL